MKLELYYGRKYPNDLNPAEYGHMGEDAEIKSIDKAFVVQWGISLVFRDGTRLLIPRSLENQNRLIERGTGPLMPLFPIHIPTPFGDTLHYNGHHFSDACLTPENDTQILKVTRGNEHTFLCDGFVETYANVYRMKPVGKEDFQWILHDGPFRIVSL